MPGLDRLRFPRKLPLDLLCPLCSEVLDAPIQCLKCNLIFCTNCTTSSECDHQLSSVTKYLIDKLNSLEIKCKYWYNGCDKILKIPLISQHERKCDKIPNKEFNEQEDLLFECPQGCQKLCSMPEIKGKHSCIAHLQEKIIELDKEYTILFEENSGIDRENIQIEKTLSQKKNEIKELSEIQNNLKNIFNGLEKEKEEKIIELSKYSVETMNETYNKIQENFGDNLLDYKFTKTQNEELYKEFSEKITKEMNNIISKNSEIHKKTMENLRKELLDSLKY